jgi:biofilm PGA synthesis protein PgaD
MNGAEEKMIIEKPQAQDKKQRLAQGAVTAAFWFLFICLLRPLFTLVAWLVGVVLFSREMVGNDRLFELGRVLVWYGLVILVIGFVLRSWAWYNQKRFAGRDKRRTVPHFVSVEELAAFNRVDSGSLAGWQRARRLLVRHDPEGRVIGVETGDFGPAEELSFAEEAGRPQTPFA